MKPPPAPITVPKAPTPKPISKSSTAVWAVNATGTDATPRHHGGCRLGSRALARVVSEQTDSVAEHRALRRRQLDHEAGEFGLLRRAVQGGGHRDSAGLRRELPQQVIDRLHILFRDGQRLSAVKSESNRAARHRGEYRKPLQFDGSTGGNRFARDEQRAWGGSLRWA